MVAVRFVVLAALVVWLGGLVTLELVVSPAVGHVLPGSAAAAPAGPEAGRVLAGLVMNATWQRFHLVAYACGAIVFFGLFVMKFVGPPPAAFVPRLGLAVAMLVSAMFIALPGARAVNVGLALLSLFWYARE